MNQKLLEGKERSSSITVPASNCPISRYNFFIDIYNNPNNQVDCILMQRMGTHRLFTIMYEWLRPVWTKVLLMLLLLCAPFLNVVLLLFIFYYLVVYLIQLRLFNRNREKVADPFRNMVYDPQICHSLRRDYYFFEVELKELEGFTFNYNEHMKRELTLRKERGKVKFMVYSPQFWSHYNSYPQHQLYYIGATAASTLLVALSMTLFIVFVIL